MTLDGSLAGRVHPGRRPSAPTRTKDTMENHTDTTPQSRDYTVTGMTCAHCVLSVREEVGEVAGVASIDVDLESGRMTVTGSDLHDEAITAAVADAGYTAVRQADC